jgi:hypothetical protein
MRRLTEVDYKERKLVLGLVDHNHLHKHQTQRNEIISPTGRWYQQLTNQTTGSRQQNIYSTIKTQ